VSGAGGLLRKRLTAFSIGAGERLLAPIERHLGRRSLCGEAPFFEPSRFGWVAELERGAPLMRAELERLLRRREQLPSFQEISSDQRALTDDDRWKTFFLYGYGHRTELGRALCPQTTALVERVPGMLTAMFSILSPGKRIPPHRGPYKGLLRYHLGLIVPQPAASCWIRVGTEVRHWQEGASLLFDDTYEHEVANESDQLRAVLFLDVIRPLPRPERELNRAVIAAIAHSPFIAEARRNQRAWEQRFLATGGLLDAGQAGAVQQFVCLGVQDRELAGHDQDAEGDHHRAAGADHDREVAAHDRERAGQALEGKGKREEGDCEPGRVAG